MDHAMLTIGDVISQYPRTFQLRASAVPFGNPTDMFRIDRNASYRNDAGDAQLVLERNVNGAGVWLQFGKVYTAELDDNIIQATAYPSPMSSYFPKTITLRGQEITFNGSRGRVFIDDIFRRKGGSQLQILIKNAHGGETCVGYIPLPAWGYARQRAWAVAQDFEIA